MDEKAGLEGNRGKVMTEALNSDETYETKTQKNAKCFKLDKSD